MKITRLSSGYYHIRGNGPCNWAQPPSWPCGDDVLDASFFPEAGDAFRRQVREARDAAEKETA